MAGRVIFLAVDESIGLDADARELVRGASVIAASPRTAALFPSAALDLDLETIVDRARRGEIVLRAVTAAPVFDDRALGEIAELAEAPIELHVVPSAGVRALPLFGKRVLVTRAREQAGETLRLLRRRGAVPVLLPTIEIGPPDDPSALARAARELGRYDVVAFTSANGVAALFRAIDEAGLDVRAFGGAKIASIGPGTRAALQKRAIRVDLEPEEHRGEGLARALLELHPKRVLVPRAAVAREVLPEMLRGAGIVVDVVEAYRTRRPEIEELDLARARLRDAPPDAILFTSSSTVENFVELFSTVNASAIVASIGPITSDTCRRLGLRVDVEASPYTLPSLVEALEKTLSGR
jgi:uroporphyrinogen III methyltransferase/synthase